MNILERYIFGRCLRAALLVFVGLNGVMWIIWATRGEIFFAAGLSSALHFLSLTFLVLPLLSASLIPFALLIGGLIAFGRLNRDAELVILDAAGALRKTIWRPVAVLSVFAMVLSAVLSVEVGPGSMRKFEKSVADGSASLIFSVFQQGEFKQLADGLTVHVGGLSGTSGLHQIFISDERDRAVHFIYYAANGTVVERNEGAFLALANGEIHRIERASETASIVKFDSYAFDFSSLLATQRVQGYPINARPLSELLSPAADDQVFKQQPELLKRELLERFSAPLYALAFGAAALFFGARVSTGRQSQFLGGFLAFVLCGALRATGWGALGIASSSSSLSILPFVIPLGAAALFFGLFLTGNKNPLPEPMSRFLETTWDALFNRIARFVRKVTKTAEPTQ